MSDSDFSKPWPSENVGPKDHLHALGVISVYYNLFEEALGLFFSTVAKHYEVGEFLYRRLNNQERLETLKFHFWTQEKYSGIFGQRDNELLAHIDHLIVYCSICIDNRNILMHSRHDRSTDSIFSLQKSSKAAHAASKLNYYHVSLEEIRRVGDEIIRGVHLHSRPQSLCLSEK
jgi:hypothetical protein